METVYAMNEKKQKKWLCFRAGLVALGVFLLLNAICHLLILNQRNREMLKASYTAEETVRRIESKLDNYLTKSDLFKRILESGDDMEDQDFYALAELMMDEDGVIQAFEMAKDGTVNLISPLKDNEEAMGLDMLTYPPRAQAANLAKDSGEYTIAGPFELVQGGQGALLFDPIYEKESGSFWGFSILVIDWDAFVRQLGLENLENASYYYRIWRMDGEKKLILAQASGKAQEKPLEVECDVPNDVWHFEIAPTEGWYSGGQALFISVMCLVFGLLVALTYWQWDRRRQKEADYARQIQKTAEKAQAANEAKTRFLFNMSHDIRTPMNAIVGFSDLLEAHLDEPEKARDYVAKIRDSGAFLLSLLNQILEMARIESGTVSLSREPVDLDAFLRSLKAVFEPSIAQKRLQADTVVSVTDRYVWADETKLREVLLNIVSNAVKYTPDGGSVHLSIRQIPEAREGWAAFEMQVTDTGIGMSEDYLPHIFEEFSREHNSTETKIPGTGLGMPIVKSLVEKMGGTIRAESKLGQGTTITLRLSFQKAARSDCREVVEQPPKKTDFRGKRVLLAEDNDLNAEIAMTILQESGIETERAKDGAEAVDMAEHRPEGWYDLILMDIQMPGMDGYHAARAIRSLPGPRGTVPILAMTANAFAEDRAKALESGMNGHIAKPIGMEQLLKELEKWV